MKEISGGSMFGMKDIPQSVHDTLSSPGRPLDGSTRAFMEPRFGHDFSQVRIHTDSRAAASARAINAQAYTVGNDVIIGGGQYSPDSSKSKQLIGHELTHVLQQGDFTNSDIAGNAAQNQPLSITSLGNHYIQRACGLGNIPASNCSEMSLDIPEAFNVSRRFLFDVNCDTFQAGEAEAMIQFVRSTARSSADLIQIHGFASIEGPFDYNADLACARARKAQNALEFEHLYPSASPAPISHGAVEGDRTQMRSVIVVVQTATPPPTPQPAQPAPSQSAGQRICNRNQNEQFYQNSPDYCQDTPSTGKLHPNHRCYRELPDQSQDCPSGEHVCFSRATGDCDPNESHIDAIAPTLDRGDTGECDISYTGKCSLKHFWEDVL